MLFLVVLGNDREIGEVFYCDICYLYMYIFVVIYGIRVVREVCFWDYRFWSVCIFSE